MNDSQIYLHVPYLLCEDYTRSGFLLFFFYLLLILDLIPKEETHKTQEQQGRTPEGCSQRDCHQTEQNKTSTRTLRPNTFEDSS